MKRAAKNRFNYTATRSSAPARPKLTPTRANRVNKYRGRRTKRASSRSFRDVFGAIFVLVMRTGKVVFSGVFAIILVLSLSVGLIVGYRYLLAADYFSVRKVVLSGLQQVAREEVLWRTGLDKPANILSLKLADMATAVRELEWVADVAVTRQLPDTIVVQVRERKAKALIDLGGLYYLDQSGVPFKKLDPGHKPEMPVITGFVMEDLTLRPEFAKNDLKEVFDLMETLAIRNDRFRLENIAEVNFDPVRGLSLFTREERVQVKVGLGDYAGKLQRLGRVLAQLKIQGRADGLTYFNLETSPRVVVRRSAEG